MATKAHSLGERLIQRTKALYLNRGHALGYSFPSQPFARFNKEWFRAAFASAAQANGLRFYEGKSVNDLTPEELVWRQQYIRYFRITWKQIQAALKRLTKNAAATPPLRQCEIIREIHALPIPARSRAPQVRTYYRTRKNPTNARVI